MTPLLAALSSRRVAARSAVVVVAASPPSAASRKRRTAVFNSDLTALLRSRRRSFVPLRLICDLMLATRNLPRDWSERRCSPTRLAAPRRRVPLQDHHRPDDPVGASFRA